VERDQVRKAATLGGFVHHGPTGQNQRRQRRQGETEPSQRKPKAHDGVAQDDALGWGHGSYFGDPHRFLENAQPARRQVGAMLNAAAALGVVLAASMSWARPAATMAWAIGRWPMAAAAFALYVALATPVDSLVLAVARLDAPSLIPSVAVLAAAPLLLVGLLALPARRLWGLAGMATAFTTMNVGHGMVRRLLRPQYLWVAYPGTEQDKRHYFPAWVERVVRPLYSTGLMRFGRYWGLMVAGKVTAESLDDSPERLREMLDEARSACPGVQVIALAGRLPSLAIKAGIPLEAPFTQGDKGTLCTMVMTARKQASLLGRTPGELVIAVVGGAGFIGGRLTEELSGEFRHVICLDPRFSERREAGTVLYTAEPEDVAAADAVLVLTSRGEQAASVIPFLTPGTVVADDTHPEMPRNVRREMEGTGALVLKATMGDTRFRIMPRVAFFRSDDIPGCVLEALVVLERGREVLASQAVFNDAASALGFGARLAPHMSSG